MRSTRPRWAIRAGGRRVTRTSTRLRRGQAVWGRRVFSMAPRRNFGRGGNRRGGEDEIQVEVDAGGRPRPQRERDPRRARRLRSRRRARRSGTRRRRRHSSSLVSASWTHEDAGLRSPGWQLRPESALPVVNAATAELLGWLNPVLRADSTRPDGPGQQALGSTASRPGEAARHQHRHVPGRHAVGGSGAGARQPPGGEAGRRPVRATVDGADVRGRVRQGRARGPVARPHPRDAAADPGAVRGASDESAR